MAEDWLHIDVLYLGPTEEFPFNKLITMGESDFKMPKKNYLGIKRNEYMIFYDKNIDVLKNKDDFEFFMNALFLPGICVRDQNEFIEPYHEVTSDFENSNMVSSLLIFPQVMKKTSEIVIKLGTFKKCMCLQVMPINQVESEYGDQYGSLCFGHSGNSGNCYFHSAGNHHSHRTFKIQKGAEGDGPYHQ